MRRIVVRTLSTGIVLALAGSCTGDPEETIATSSVVDVTGGVIIVSGDLSAGSAADGGGDESSDAAGPPSTGESTDLTTTPTTATTATTRATRSPTTRPPSTTSSVAETTEAPVIGDGPVLTVLAGIDESGESPGVGTGLTPVFFALEATTKVACSVADPGTVSVRWEVIGVETVDVAVRTSGNIRSADQPPAGTIDLPLDCTNGSQYFVIAENPDGTTTRSVSVTAR